MSVSTNGIICFGHLLEEGFELPWDEEDEGDEDGWWHRINGYNPPFVMYNDSGEYIDRSDPPTKERINEYHDHAQEWLKRNPMPFVSVNCCSSECPIYIIAVPESVEECRRGYPEVISPTRPEIVSLGLVAFLKLYLKVDADLKWYLASYLG